MIFFLAIVAYVAVMLGVGVWKSRTTKSQDDFMVAGRSVSTVYLVGTLVCTWIGSRIWQLVEQPRTVDSLCAQLVREFDVDAETCRTEVFALLADLRTEKLIRLSSGPGPEPGP